MSGVFYARGHGGAGALGVEGLGEAVLVLGDWCTILDRPAAWLRVHLIFALFVDFILVR